MRARAVPPKAKAKAAPPPTDAEQEARDAFAEALKRPNTPAAELARLADAFPVRSGKAFPVRVVRTVDLLPFFRVGGFALADEAYQVVWEHYWWVGDVLGCEEEVLEGREGTVVAFRHGGDLEARTLWPGDVDQHFWRYVSFWARVESRLDAEALARVTKPPAEAWMKQRRAFDLPSLHLQAYGPERAPWHGAAGYKLDGLRLFLREVFGRGLLHGHWLAQQRQLLIDESDADRIIELAAEGGLVTRGKRELYAGQLPDKADHPTRFVWMPVRTEAAMATIELLFPGGP